MESRMDISIGNIDSENEQLHISLENAEATYQTLCEENISLKAALDKQKVFHRNFVEEVNATEELRIEEFNDAKQGFIQENQSLSKVNHRLVNELEFYRKALDESDKNQSMTSTTIDSLSEKNALLEKALDREKKFHRKYVEDLDANEAIRQRDYVKEKRELMNEIKALKKENRQLVTDVAFYSLTSHKSISYRLPSKISNEKRLYEDNKNLKLKILAMTSNVASLKKKNLQLINFQNKIENKKAKFEKDSEMLNWLVHSSNKLNKDTYTPQALTMLFNLARSKK